MKLIKAWTGDLDRAYELFGKFQADEHGFVNDAYGLSRDEFAQYMRKVEDMHAGRNLPEGYVPATKYILVNDSGTMWASSTCGTVSTIVCAKARGISATVSRPSIVGAATPPPDCA